MQENLILFTPFQMGTLTLPNRVVMAPMTRNLSPNNISTDEMLHYYKRRAEGGTGLIITEGTFINHPVANGYPDVPAFYGEALEMWKKIVTEVHNAGAKIMPQIWHTGMMRTAGVSPNPELLPMGPMDIFENEKQIIKAMTQNDINDVIQAFTQAAIDAKELGFDGIEIHGAHQYLIDQFLWEKSNQRTDKYGGSLENRIRFAREVVTSIRKAVGKEFPILFRFSQWKLTDYDAKIVQTPEELEVFLLSLVDAGVDIFHASQRRFWEKEFADSPLSLASWTKKITRKPVITVGSVGIDNAFELDIFSGKKVDTQPQSIALVEQQLQAEAFDLVGVGRALLADPDWANKMKLNQIDEVIPFTTDSLSTLS